MESSERITLVEYLLQCEFKGHGWAGWLLTRPPTHFPRSQAEQAQDASDAKQAEIAKRRKELEALSDDELRCRGAEVRVRELEVELQMVQDKAVRLERENVALRAAQSNRANEEPIATRERRTLLCIIGGLAKGNGLELSEPYKAGAAVAAMMPEIRLSDRTIGDYLKQVQGAMDSRRT